MYPTVRQRRVLGRLFGAKRKVWNWSLQRRECAYRTDGTRLNWVALSREFTELRRAPETAWLAELPREPFNQVLRDLERAYQNFFAKRAAHPTRRRFGTVRSVRFTLDQRREQVWRGSGGRWAYVQLPGLGRVKLRRTEVLEGRLRSVTLSRDGAGRYFAALTADGVRLCEPLPAPVAAVGVDAGLRDLAVIHDGERARSVPAPKALAGKLTRLRRYQRRQSRQLAAQMRAQGLDPAKPCAKGVRLGMSRRRARTRTRMSRRSFRRSVADAALGELRRQITYKGAWADRQVVAVDTFYPSSKICSACGVANGELKLQKHWSCPACEASHDRDVNAARNLRAEGLRIIAACSPATAKREASHARGVACVADATRRATVLAYQRRPTAIREAAQRPARAATRQAPSGTGRRRVRAGL